MSTFMLKGTVYKVPYLTHLYIFTLYPQNNPAPFFLYISHKGIPFLKTLTWYNIIKHHTKYMMYFFKRIKFRYYILICISSPLVCILYRKGDNISILVYGQGFDQACHPFFSVSQDATTNNKGSRVKFSHNQ